MRLRHLRLRLQTSDGPYGADVPFPDGMVVIWADNSMGKSTCVKSILVALGLEAILTTSLSDLPLTPVMKSIIEDELGNAHQVIESRIYLELENREGHRIAVERVVKSGSSRDHNLITVHNGPALTSPKSNYVLNDYFLNRQGSASHDRGFHFFLAQFLGWKLPEVQTFDGKNYFLYIQCVFPFLLVEQSRGWSTIQPPIPAQFRIKDAYKRSVEFLLDLDAHKIARLRADLQAEKYRLDAEWTSVLRRLGEVASSISGKPQGLPPRPIALWPVELEPTILVPVGNGWTAIEERLERYTQDHQKLVGEEIPRVQEIATATAIELNRVERALKDREALHSRILQSLELEQGEVESVRQRIAALDEDIQKNRDLRVLRNMGSKFVDHINSGICPTCEQSISDTLIPLENGQSIMPLEENIKFLNEQRRTFEGVLKNAERRVEARLMQIGAMQAELGAMRQEIRFMRQTLVSDGRLPSEQAIRQRIILEQNIDHLGQTLARFKMGLEQLVELAKRASDLFTRLDDLPAEDTSQSDRDKIGRWSNLFKEQLYKYGFKSYSVADINLSPDSYRPEYEGYDFPNSVSSSDLIRVIWALRHGMVELARDGTTNHPGLLLFDEPRQQGTKEVSFGALLERASEAGEYSQQVVFFTSEARDSLRRNLNGLPHEYYEFSGRVILKM